MICIKTKLPLPDPTEHRLRLYLSIPFVLLIVECTCSLALYSILKIILSIIHCHYFIVSSVLSSCSCSLGIFAAWPTSTVLEQNAVVWFLCLISFGTCVPLCGWCGCSYCCCCFDFEPNTDTSISQWIEPGSDWDPLIVACVSQNHTHSTAINSVLSMKSTIKNRIPFYVLFFTF